MRPFSGSIVALLLCATAAAAQDSVREGLWEISIQGQVGGQPISSTPLVVRQCIDQQSAQDLMAQARRRRGRMPDIGLQPEGSRARWSMNCTGQVDVSGTGEVTMNSNGFNGTLDLMVGMGGQSVPMQQTLRRALGGRLQVAAGGRAAPLSCSAAARASSRGRRVLQIAHDASWRCPWDRR